MMGNSGASVRAQFGALPYVADTDKEARVLLVTSRGSGGWVMPKGSPIRGLAGPDVAAREAFEEAGVLGEVLGPRAVGAYRYAKRGGVYEVTVFLMRVERQLQHWPERGQRRLLWVNAAEAATLVRADGLAAILRRVAGGLATVLDDVANAPAAGRGPSRSHAARTNARLLAAGRDALAAAPEVPVE